MIQSKIDPKVKSILNCAEDQITSSSANRLKCIAQIEETDKNSKAKSLSLTASNEFAEGALKFKADDVVSRFIGNDVPASAAEPNGHSFIRSLASVNLERSLPNIST